MARALSAPISIAGTLRRLLQGGLAPPVIPRAAPDWRGGAEGHGPGLFAVAAASYPPEIVRLRLRLRRAEWVSV